MTKVKTVVFEHRAQGLNSEARDTDTQAQMDTFTRGEHNLFEVIVHYGPSTEGLSRSVFPSLTLENTF